MNNIHQVASCDEIWIHSYWCDCKIIIIIIIKSLFKEGKPNEHLLGAFKRLNIQNTQVIVNKVKIYIQNNQKRVFKHVDVLPCKGKMQHLLTLQVSRCLLSLQSSVSYVEAIMTILFVFLSHFFTSILNCQRITKNGDNIILLYTAPIFLLFACIWFPPFCYFSDSNRPVWYSRGLSVPVPQ